MAIVTRVVLRCRTVRFLAIGAASLTFGASAYAYVCHPDFPGTRSLTVQGRVDGYGLSGRLVTVHAWIDGCERLVVWRPESSTSSASACTSSTGEAGAGRSATVGRFRVDLVAGSTQPDQPDRLAVYDAATGSELHAWPLPAAASSVDVARGVAVVSTSNGVYVMRLADGRFALVGVKFPGDRPRIDPAGIVFQDDLYKHRSTSHSLLKFVPFSVLTHALRPFGPLHVPERIGAFSLDGRSVVFVKKDPAGRCDRIGVWTIPWHYSTDLMDEPPICPEHHAPGGISGLVLGGQFVEIVTTYGTVQTLITSTFVHCIEKVVTRATLGSGSIPTVAADGAMLAYAVQTDGSSALVGRLLGQQPSGSAKVASARQLSVDRGRVAVLRADGHVVVLQDDAVLRTLDVPGARAIALRGDELTVLTRAGTLDTYGLADGMLRHRWPVPAGTAAAVDVHYGVAVVTAGRRVFAISLATGERRVLLTAPATVRAHLDDIGVVYAYDAGRRGVLGFLPFAAVEQALAS